MAYSDKQKETIITKICKEIEQGKSLRACLREKGTPDAVTFYNWIDIDKKFFTQYARATSLRAEAIFEDILSIADDQEGDVIDVDGKEVTNHNSINRARLRVDSRKWMLSKMIPKKYGEKIDLTTKDRELQSSPIDLTKVPSAVLKALLKSLDDKEK